MNTLQKSAWVKASLNPEFYAHHVWMMAQRNGLSWPEMVHLFDATETQMFALGLCRWDPDPQAVKKVAVYTGLEVLTLKAMRRLLFCEILEK